MRANRIRIAARCFSPEKVINALASEGIFIEKTVKSAENEVVFTIKQSDSRKTFAILEKLCYNTRVECDNSFRAAAKRLLMRSGLTIGLAVTLILGVWLSQTVMFVKIEGLSGSAGLSAEQCVKSACGLPVAAKGVDLAKVKRALIDLPEIADCTLKIDGNYIIADVLPSDGYARGGSDVPIVASDDAIVTKIVTNRGTALVKPGDVVKRGQTLIGGEIMSSTGDRVLATVTPCGEVYGLVAYRASQCLTEETVVKKYTGRQKTTSIMHYSRLEPVIVSPYERYESKVSRVSFGLFLPITVTTAVYREVAYEKVKCDFEAEAKAMISELLLSVRGAVKETRTDISELGPGCKKISVYVTAEQKISP